METIIVQDTDAAILDVLAQALKMEGFEVLPVSDSKGDFLSLVDQHKPHVVILDYRLDGETSKQTCYQIKQRYPHLPIIAMSCNYTLTGYTGKMVLMGISVNLLIWICYMPYSEGIFLSKVVGSNL